MFLEGKFKNLEESYKAKGGNIIWQWFKLFLGICACILTTFWLLQFFLVNLPVAVGKPAVAPLVNTFLIAVAPVPFLGPLFYGCGSRARAPAPSRTNPTTHAVRTAGPRPRPRLTCATD